MSDTTQLSFFDENAADAVQEASEKAVGIYSGELLKKSDPDRHAAVVEMLAHGVPLKQVARLCRVSRNLVRGIAATTEIDPHRQRIAAKLRVAAELAAERMVELIETENDLSLRDVSIALGVAADKSQVLAGGATSIVRVEVADPGRAEYEAMISGRKVIDVEPLDDGRPPAMGLDVEAGGTNSGGLLRAGVVDGGAVAVPGGVATVTGQDCKSSVSDDFPNVFGDISGMVASLVAVPEGGSGAPGGVCARGDRGAAGVDVEPGGEGVRPAAGLSE